MKVLSQVSDHIIVKDTDNDGSECIYVSICAFLSLLVYVMMLEDEWVMTSSPLLVQIIGDPGFGQGIINDPLGF